MFISVIRYHTHDCSYLSTEGVIMLNRFPTKRWPHHNFHWELCGTDFPENVANLRVLCDDENNDRAVRVLFVRYPREQGETLKWFCKFLPYIRTSIFWSAYQLVHLYRKAILVAFIIIWRYRPIFTNLRSHMSSHYANAPVGFNMWKGNIYRTSL